MTGAVKPAIVQQVPHVACHCSCAAEQNDFLGQCGDTFIRPRARARRADPPQFPRRRTCTTRQSNHHISSLTTRTSEALWLQIPKCEPHHGLRHQPECFLVRLVLQHDVTRVEQMCFEVHVPKTERLHTTSQFQLALGT